MENSQSSGSQDQLMLMARARRRRAEAESASANPDANASAPDAMGARTDASGQKFIEPIKFTPDFKNEQEKQDYYKDSPLRMVGAGLGNAADVMVAGPINMATKAVRDAGTGLLTAGSDFVLDPIFGTNTGDTIRKAIPQVRTNNTAEDIGANVAQYAPTVSAIKNVPNMVRNMPDAVQNLSRMAQSFLATVGVTEPSQASTVGNLVGGPTEITPTDTPADKRLKVGAEGVVANKVVDAVVSSGGKMGQMAKQFFGPDGEEFIAAAPSKGFTGPMPLTNDAEQTLQAFDRQGVEAPAAAIAQNTRLSNADNALSNLPMSSQRMAAQRERITGENAPLPGKASIPDRVAAVSGGKSTSEIDAGKAIQQGAQQYKDKFQEMAGKRFSAFDSKVAPDLPVDVTNTRSLLDNMYKTQSAQKVADRTMNSSMKSLIDDLTASKEVDTGVVDAAGNAIKRTQPAEMSWEGMRLLRDRVGAALRDPGLMPDIPTTELKRLYGSITEDMRGSISTQSPALLKEFDQNSAFYKKGIASVESGSGKYIEKDRAGNFKKNPENVYRETMGAQNSAERATQWRKLRNQLPKDKWEVVQAEEIRNLGKPNSSNPNDFSVQTYLKKWNDITPAEKEALFSGEKYTAMRRDLDDLAKINDSLAKVKSFSNTSNTAPQSWYMRILSGQGSTGLILGGFTGGAPGAVVGAGLEAAGRAGAPYAAARVMTSPGFVRWLADGSKQAARDPATIPAFLTRLTAVANQEKDPETKKDILSYQKAAQKEYKKSPPALAPAGKPQSDAGPKFNPRLVSAIGKLESNNNPNAQANGSSAKGSHQFTDGTWQRMVNKYGRDAGIGMNDRTDAKKSEFMANKLAEENFDQLKDRIGRAPTDAEVYMAHVLGAGGASRVIKEFKSGRTAAEILPEAAKVAGNKPLFYNGKTAKTVKDFYADMAKKLAAA